MITVTEANTPVVSSRSEKRTVVAAFRWVYLLNQANRQVLFPVFPLRRRELRPSDTPSGLLGSSFQWVYALLVPVAGVLDDVLSRRNLIVLALLVLRLATFSSGFTTGFALLLTLRALTVGWLNERIGVSSALASSSVFYLMSASVLLATCSFWFRSDTPLAAAIPAEVKILEDE